MKVHSLSIAVTAEEVAQEDREKAAWDAYLDAVKRQNKTEATRLWNIYTDIHRQRPDSMVRRLERAKGLS